MAARGQGKERLKMVNSNKTKILMMNLMVVFLLPVMVFAQVQKGWFRNTTDLVQSSPCLADLKNDGKKEIILPSFDDKLYVWNLDGTNFSISGHTFPVSLGFGDGTISSIAVGDFDGDTSSDLVIAGDDKDGKNPRIIVLNLDTFTTISYSLPNTSASFKSTVALSDCYRYQGAQKHPGKEIICRDGDGRVYVIAMRNGQLDLLTSSTVSMWTTVTDTNKMDHYGNMPITPSVSVYRPNDTTSQTLIVTSSTDGNLYEWRVYSDTSRNWSETSPTIISIPNGGWFLSSPAVGDIDNNTSNGVEIIAGSNDKRLYVWGENGDLRTSMTTEGWIVSSPALADLDGDGDKEIIVGCDDFKVYAFHHNGTPVTGWPQTTEGDVFASPVVAELDGEAGLEVVAASFDRRIYAWHQNGIPLDNWPKKLESPIYSTPAIGDLEGGGRLSVVAASFTGKVCVWRLKPKSLNPNVGWQQFRGSEKRDGIAP